MENTVLFESKNNLGKAVSVKPGCLALFGKVAAVSLAASFTSISLFGATNNYTGPNDGDWFTAGNWSLKSVPTADDDVTLTKNVTVKANGSVSANSITVTTGTLDISNASDDPAFAVTVAGDVTLSGSGKMYVRAGRTPGLVATDWQASAALLWANANKVNIGGTLTVGAGATLYSANHKETGTPVVFNVGGNLVVAAGGTISTRQLGHNWMTADNPPEGAVNNSGKTGYYTYAFGAGNAYNRTAGYGGAGNNASYGKPYGYRFAPFLSGSPAGIHSGLPATAPGSIVLMIAGKAMVAGTITAAADNNAFSANSGGGIWLCAATADIADTALITVEGGTCTNYGSIWGGGGRLALCFGLTATDIAAMAAGEEPEGLTAVSPCGFNWTAVGGKDNRASDSYRGNAGTAFVVYRAETVTPRSVSGTPSNMGTVSPAYGLHVFPANEIPEFTAPSAIYPDGYRNQRRYGTVVQTTVSGDQPGVVWNFSDEQYLLRVQLVGTGSVSLGGAAAQTASFEQWVNAGETTRLTASGDFAGWYGDFTGGVTNQAALALQMDSPRLVQAVFENAAGTTRTYAGADGGFWDVAANWTPAGVPTPLDDLTIPAGAFARGVNALAVHSLTVAGYLALGGDTRNATTEQNLTDLAVGWYGLVLADNLIVSGGLTLGSRSQNCMLSSVTVGGDVTLSSSGMLAVYAPEQAGAITSPFAEFYANRMVVPVGGDFALNDTSTLYPVGDRRTGTPIDWEVTGDFSLASGATIDATGLGFNWTTVDDARKTQSTSAGGIAYYTLSPGSPGSSYTIGGCYGAGSCAYGFAVAPFLPGAPSSIYGNFGAGGGVVWIHALGQLSLAGAVKADAEARTGTSYSGGAGGSVWLLGKKIEAESTASLSAQGSKQTHSNTLSGAGTGGRIALGVGLTDAQIAALAAGTATSEIEGVTVQEDITLVTATARGGVYAKKDTGNVTVYGESGTLATVSGAAADVIVTVVGSPVEPTGEDGPEYGPAQCPQGEDATFTATAVAELARDNGRIRYNIQGWVVSNATTEVASGTGTTATFKPGKEALTLTWLWGGRETQSVAVPNDSELGSVLVDGKASETGAAWTHETDDVAFTAVPAEGAEFLYWIGDVPFGQTLTPALSVKAEKVRNLTAVFRTAEPATTRTWIGKANLRGEWLDAAKWNPAGIPGLDDDVLITQGTVDATNVLAVGSLTVVSNGIVWVGATAASHNVARDVNLYMETYPSSKTTLEEVLVSVKRNLVFEGKGQIAVGTRNQVYHSRVNIGGDLLLNGTNIFQVAAGRLEDAFTLVTGAGWVTVGGMFKVGGRSVVYPLCEGYTGGTMVFRADRFMVETNATIDATASGYSCLLSRTPAHHAPGVGTEYAIGGGYGGYGLRDFALYPVSSDSAGKTYGQAYAPIHPGSPLGGWGGANDWGGGLIRVHAKCVAIDGTLNARASARTDRNAQNEPGGGGAGGGIWVTCAGMPVIGPTAQFLAYGALRATGAGCAGGGGRIALAAHVTDAQVAELAETGTVSTWRPNGSHFVTQSKFEDMYPGVTVNVEPGETPAAEYLDLTRGTFWYIDGGNIGFTLLLR